MNIDEWIAEFRRYQEKRYSTYFGWLKQQIALSALLISVFVTFQRSILTGNPIAPILLALAICSLLAAVLSGGFALYGEVQLYDTLCRASYGAIENCRREYRSSGKTETGEFHRVDVKSRYLKLAHVSFAAFAAGIFLLSTFGVVNLV